MILIFLVVLLLFGGKKLPELARGLGKGLREFKDASDGIKREIHNNINTVSEVTADIEKTVTSTEPFAVDPAAPAQSEVNSEAVNPEESNSAAGAIEQTKIAH